MFESFKNVMNKVAEYAPSIALGLTNPIAGVAQAAYTALSSAVGETDPAKLAQKFAIGLTPDEQLAIKKQDYQYKLDMAKFEIDDRMDAREREVALSNSKYGWMSLSIMNIAGLFAMALVGMITYNVLYINKDAQLQTMVITFDLMTIAASFFYYIWGKSKDSNNVD
jgi:hypothetical protein